MNFKSWQHWRWSGGGREKCTPTEAAIKKVDTSSEKPKNGK